MKRLIAGLVAGIVLALPLSASASTLERDKMERTALAAFLESLEGQTADRLCGRTPSGKLGRSQLWKLQRMAARCSVWLKQNVGTKHITGLLAAEGAASGENRG